MIFAPSNFVWLSWHRTPDSSPPPGIPACPSSFFLSLDVYPSPLPPSFPSPLSPAPRPYFPSICRFIHFAWLIRRFSSLIPDLTYHHCRPPFAAASHHFTAGPEPTLTPHIFAFLPLLHPPLGVAFLPTLWSSFYICLLLSTFLFFGHSPPTTYAHCGPRHLSGYFRRFLTTVYYPLSFRSIDSFS